ncbi:MAG TPA: protein phosphatase CheZ [Xanthobacteraceae bacterium]|nr:protein phosphatase CheZ [Xanthobacteraceae bacterium]
MALRRNVFRIEELAGLRPAAEPAAAGTEVALRHAEIMTELRALRQHLAARETAQERRNSADNEACRMELGAIHDAVQRTKQEIAAILVNGFANAEMGRVSNELKAVIGGSESATHRILEAGEEIEEAAKTLAAALRNVQDQDLARDILDQVTRIFEACNFQDLTGQRISKVSATINYIEERLHRLSAIWGGVDQLGDLVPAARGERAQNRHLCNGPKLEGDLGDYVSQKEIDALFARSG